MLVEQGVSAAAPISGVTACGDESDLNVEDELAEIIDEDRAAAYVGAANASGASSSCIVDALPKLGAERVGANSRWQPPTPNGVHVQAEATGYVSDVEKVHAGWG